MPSTPSGVDLGSGLGGEPGAGLGIGLGGEPGGRRRTPRSPSGACRVPATSVTFGTPATSVTPVALFTPGTEPAETETEIETKEPKP